MVKAGKLKIGTISMTGFGKSIQSQAGLKLTCEIKSVNSRFLDLVCKLPREYGAYEHVVREIIQTKLQRGRVEVFVSRVVAPGTKAQIEFNQGLFDAYMEVEQKLSKKFGGTSSDKFDFARELLLRKDILAPGDSDLDFSSEVKVLKRAVEGALIQLTEMRSIEGRKLGEDLSGRIGEMSSLADKLEKLAAGTPALIKERLLSRVRKLAPEVLVDPGKLAEQAAFLAERVDVTEELVRLRAHLGELESSLRAVGSGRRLDFLVQEVGRELNTIGSKAQDAKVQTLVVDGKTLAEKIREQTQNIE